MGLRTLRGIFFVLWGIVYGHSIASAVEVTLQQMGESARLVANFSDGSRVAIDFAHDHRAPTVRWLKRDGNWDIPQTVQQITRMPVSQQWPENTQSAILASNHGLYYVNERDKILVLAENDGFVVFGAGKQRIFVPLPQGLEMDDVNSFALDSTSNNLSFLHYTTADGRPHLIAIQHLPMSIVSADAPEGVVPNPQRLAESVLLGSADPKAFENLVAATLTNRTTGVSSSRALVPLPNGGAELTMRPNQSTFSFATGTKLVMRRVGPNAGVTIEFKDGREPILVTQDSVIQYPVLERPNGPFEQPFSSVAHAVPLVTEKGVFLIRSDGTVEELNVNMNRLAIQPIRIRDILDRKAQMLSHSFTFEGQQFLVCSFEYRAETGNMDGTAAATNSVSTSEGETFLIPEFGESIRVAYRPLENSSSVPASRIDNGILSLRGIERRIDLTRLDAEATFRPMLVPNPRDKENKEVKDVIAAVEAIFPNMMITLGPGGQEPHALSSSDGAVIDRIRAALASLESGSGVILGPSGSGKTQLMEGFIAAVARGAYPEIPRTVRFLKLDRATLMQGMENVGNIESRVSMILAMAARVPVILSISELHTLIGAGSSRSSSVDVMNMLKDALARGQIRILGDDTFAEFYQAFGGDSAILRRIMPIVRGERSRAEIEAAIDSWIRHHRMPAISPELRAYVYETSENYLAIGAQPSKATKLLDTAYADHRRIRGERGPLTKEAVDRALVTLGADPLLFDPVAAQARLEKLETEFPERVIGQEEVRDAMIAQERRRLRRLNDRTRPANSFLVTGPFGTGKTHSFEVFADLSGRNKKVLNGADFPDHRLEVFQQALVQGLREASNTFFIVDEVHLAGKKVQALMLAIHNGGVVELPDYVTPGQTRATGTTVADFRNAGFGLTTNAGFESLPEILGTGPERVSLGIDVSRSASAPTESAAMIAMRNRLRQDLAIRRAVAEGILPALVDRIEAVLPSRTATQAQFRRITEIQLARLKARTLRETGAELVITNEAEFLDTTTAVYYDPSAGNRIVARFLEVHLGASLSNAMASRSLNAAPIVRIELTFDPKTAQTKTIFIDACEASALPKP